MDEMTDEESDLISGLTTIEKDVNKIVAAVKSLPTKMLHAFCLYYEGKAVEPFMAALESKHCDRSTATMIYWTSDPLQFAGKQTVLQADLKDFELFKRAETKLLTGTFPRSKCRFDPVVEMGYDMAYWQSVRTSPHIPAKLKPKLDIIDLVPQWLLFQTFKTVPGEQCRKADCQDDRISNSNFCRAHHFEMIYKQPPPT